MSKQPSLLDPADDLAQILGPDLAREFLAHRKALKAPMTSFAASLMAKKLRTFADPIAAVEQSILKGWRDVFEVKGAPAGRSSAPTFNDLASFYDAQSEREGRDSEGTGSLFPDVPKLTHH